jgi:tetratricopeptide (TPR) repeat protein
MKRIQASILILAIFMAIFSGYLFPTIAAAEMDYWVGKIVSVQGSVQVRRTGATEWVPVRLNDTYAFGDMIRVQEQSRAAVVLRNEAILRLDQNTTITFSASEEKGTSLLNMFNGAAHFFSPTPRKLKVTTPFVNAAISGTEFFVRVERNQTLLSVFEGRVAAINEAGSLILGSGQSAIARTGQAPVSQVVVRPRDAVQWTLYYPPILDYQPSDFPSASTTDWQAMVRKSIGFFREGDLAMAFSSLKGVPEDIQGPRFFIYRAALHLSVGRVDDASADIARALVLDPIDSHAFALQSIIAVAQNRKEQALDLARKAVDLAPESSAARVALAYAQQAHFDIRGALASLEEAAKLDPGNALVRAREAELQLSLGYLDRAVAAARQAVSLNPYVARTQSVLGFAYLTEIKTRDAKNAFKKAIRLDQAAPLPRLGLGLARIREGDLKEGRTEIEIAASLDPDNSLIRSYLGKAYFEEKRDKAAQNQLAMAKELDPLDPTPWFYDAIRKQTINRPVEALQNLQKSIELNDNRAVYRSRMLLDEDLAARSASLGRIYNDLGFQQLALVEGYKSLNTDPANYSAHRFLADSYAALPRHEIARVSELLQSQLLQPINITPVQPQLGESKLLIFSGAGPGALSFNEFNPLFNRNRLALQFSGVAGGNDTLGNELVVSAVYDSFSVSAGQFHYEDDGFRGNNDLEQDIYNVFAQASLTHKTSVQAEFRATNREKGDLPLRFDPDNFSRNLRQKEDSESIRLGMRHSFAPCSDIIATFIYKDTEGNTHESLSSVPIISVDILEEEDHYMVEMQHLFRSERLNVTSGVGHFSSDRKITVKTSAYTPPAKKTSPRHTNPYVYSQINFPENMTWTVGGSADFFEGGIVDRDQFNPKLGLTWSPLAATSLRAAVFRTFRRTLISSQTLEPTQVAGFNQLFDDREGTESWRYGTAIDQRFSPDLYGGIEFSERDMDIPFWTLTFQVERVDWEERMGRAYLYWTPYKWVGTSAEYEYERFERGLEFVGPEEIQILETRKLPLGINFYHPSGFATRLKATYIDQEGVFGDPRFGTTVKDSDQFWVVDASISYHLPKRRGVVTIEARNLLNEEFKFQDMDPASPVIYPESLIFAKVTLAL